MVLSLPFIDKKYIGVAITITSKACILLMIPSISSLITHLPILKHALQNSIFLFTSLTVDTLLRLFQALYKKYLNSLVYVDLMK